MRGRVLAVAAVVAGVVATRRRPGALPWGEARKRAELVAHVAKGLPVMYGIRVGITSDGQIDLGQRIPGHLRIDTCEFDSGRRHRRPFDDLRPFETGAGASGAVPGVWFGMDRDSAAPRRDVRYPGRDA